MNSFLSLNLAIYLNIIFYNFGERSTGQSANATEFSQRFGTNSLEIPSPMLPMQNYSVLRPSILTGFSYNSSVNLKIFY